MSCSCAPIDIITKLFPTRLSEYQSTPSKLWKWWKCEWHEQCFSAQPWFYSRSTDKTPFYRKHAGALIAVDIFCLCDQGCHWYLDLATSHKLSFSGFTTFFNPHLNYIFSYLAFFINCQIASQKVVPIYTPTNITQNSLTNMEHTHPSHCQSDLIFQNLHLINC